MAKIVGSLLGFPLLLLVTLCCAASGTATAVTTEQQSEEEQQQQVNGNPNPINPIVWSTINGGSCDSLIDQQSGGIAILSIDFMTGINVTTGEVLWKVNTSNIPEGSGAKCPATAGYGLVILPLLNTGSIAAFYSVNGSLAWIQKVQSNVGRMGWFEVTAHVGPRFVYFATCSGHYGALALETGTPLYETKTFPISDAFCYLQSPRRAMIFAADGDIAVVMLNSTSCDIGGVNMTSGEIAWKLGDEDVPRPSNKREIRKCRKVLIHDDLRPESRIITVVYHWGPYRNPQEYADAVTLTSVDTLSGTRPSSSPQPLIEFPGGTFGQYFFYMYGRVGTDLMVAGIQHANWPRTPSGHKWTVLLFKVEPSTGALLSGNYSITKRVHFATLPILSRMDPPAMVGHYRDIFDDKDKTCKTTFALVPQATTSNGEGRGEEVLSPKVELEYCVDTNSFIY